MHPILKAILIRRSGEQGFAVPMALALGLIMILLSTINIFKSQEENLTAITQRQTNQALSVAEVGVARYRELINKNRNLAIYDSGSWPPSEILCDDDDVISNAIDDWEDVDSTDPIDSSLGQYKLISYDYSGADGSAPSDTTQGILTVEGNVNGATSRLQVEIPVRAENPADYLQPALWLKNSPSNVGNLTVINGNIVVKVASGSGCSTPAAPTSVNLQNQSTQFIIADPRDFPSIPSLPATINIVTNAQINSATSLPRVGDTPDANNYYHYRVTDALTLSNLAINSGTKVILYVEGNSITFNSGVAGDSKLINEINTSPYLEIYGGSTTNSINFRGNGEITINAFIHAPSATVSVTDSPTVQVNGAVWVSNWNVSLGSITITPDDTNSSPSYSFYSSKPANKPTIFAPTSWQTVEAN